MPPDTIKRPLATVKLGPGEAPPASSISDKGAAESAGRTPGARTSTFARIRTSSFSFLADNEFIVHGYRHGYSLKEAIVSLFQVHNETTNVWTHLAGAVFFLLLLVHIATGGLQHDVHAVMEGGRGMARLAAHEVEALRQYAAGGLAGFEPAAAGAAGGVGVGTAGIHTHTPPSATALPGGTTTTTAAAAAQEMRSAFDSLRDSLASAAEHAREWSVTSAALTGLHSLEEVAVDAMSGAVHAAQHGFEAAQQGVQAAQHAAHEGWEYSMHAAQHGLAATKQGLGDAQRHGAEAAGEMRARAATLLLDLQQHAAAAAAEAEKVGSDLSAAAADRMHTLMRPLVEHAHALAELLTLEQQQQGGRKEAGSDSVSGGRGGGSEGGGSGGSGSSRSGGTGSSPQDATSTEAVRRALSTALTGLATGVTRAWTAIEQLGEGQGGGGLGPGAGRPKPRTSVLPLAVFAASALVCLSVSAAFHLLFVMNKRVFEVLARADYAGISLLIFGSLWPPVVYGFHCETTPQIAYLAITGVFCSATMALGMLDAFRSSEWRQARAGAFVVAGFSGVLPLIHLSLYRGFLSVPAGWAAFTDLILMGAQYLLGAFLYSSRIPERWSHSTGMGSTGSSSSEGGGAVGVGGGAQPSLPPPVPTPASLAVRLTARARAALTAAIHGGMIQSHMIFHLLVFGATLAHWRGSLGLYRWRAAQGEGCPA